MAGVLLALSAVIMWGAQFAVARSAFDAVDVLQSSVIRYGVPTLIAGAMLWMREGRRALRYDGHATLAWAIGLIGMTASPLLVFGAVTLTAPETVALIVATQPTMAALADWIFRSRRPARFTLFCIIAAFFGVFTVVTRWSSTLAPSPSELFGVLLALVGAMCWVAYTMVIDRFRGWSSLRLTTMTMLPGTVGTIVVCVIALAVGWIEPVSAEALWSVHWQLAYLALFGVLLGMICWNAGVQKLGSLNAVLFINLMPVVAFSIRFLRGQPFVASELIGGAIVVAALLANNLYLRQQMLKASPPKKPIGEPL